MKVTIIGCGKMGRAIGKRAVAGGHEVELIARNLEDAQSAAEEIDGAGGGSATPVEPGGAVTGDVVVLALYYPALAEAVGQYRGQLAGKAIVDISNPIDLDTFEGLVTPPDSSAAEELQQQLPDGAHVVKAFNTTFGATVAAGEVAGEPLDVFVAAAGEEAKGKVKELIEDGGMRALDAGPLRRARQLEHLAFLHIAMQEPLGAGFGSAIKLHW